MDLFQNPNEFEKVLVENKKKPLLFTVMRNSVSTIEGRIDGVYIDERALTDLECEGNIVAIDSNFHHSKLASYRPVVAKKSNRGRKKHPKKRKARKLQGDGSCFNSQITFTTVGSHIRENPLVEIAGKLQPLIDDPHSKKAKKLPGNRELVTKEYKIKVFRNGKISIPGVLTEDFSDIQGPLLDLCDYISRLFDEPVELYGLKAVMNNYKLFIKDGKIDIIQLQDYCTRHFTNLVNTKFSDIRDFILSPDYILVSEALESQDQHPFHHLYKSHEEISIDYLEMLNKLTQLGSHKNLYINFENLCEEINKAAVVEIHEKVESFMGAVYDDCFVTLKQETAARIREFMLTPILNNLNTLLSNSQDNMLSFFRYNPERYSGFVIKVKTPTENKPQKKTTIKIFPSGKINIDGAPDRKHAEYIYYWLNSIFLDNPQILYRDGDDYSDEEFSYTESEESEEIVASCDFSEANSSEANSSGPNSSGPNSSGPNSSGPNSSGPKSDLSDTSINQ